MSSPTIAAVGPATREAETGSAIARLRNPMPRDRVTSWLVALAIAGLAFGLRVYHLGVPNRLVFDETYYAKDAYSLLRFGYEREWPSDANAQITAGDVDVFQDGPAFIVHPQLGKWLIAAGERAFGMSSFGWRISACLFGALLVLVTVRMARRLSRSTLIGAIAGLLLTFDGLAFVMSRIALLDIFQAVFVVVAVSLLLVDRDWFRGRLAQHLEHRGLTRLPSSYGPLTLFRPWRLAAWVSFGLACGVKWNTVYLMAAFGLLCVVWDVGARRLAGAGRSSALSVLLDGLPAAVSMALVSGLVYLATWASWLAGTGGYDRDWAAEHPQALSTRLLGGPLASLLQYHRDIYGFHRGDFITQATHAYNANPAGWLVLARPIGIDAVNDIPPGTEGCPGPENCLRVISGNGTPILWWAAVACLIIAVVVWACRRDWRFGVPIVGVAAGWLPWFLFTDRPQFFFYAILIIPFSATAVALCLGLLFGQARDEQRLGVGRSDRFPLAFPATVAGGFVLLVIANFAYMYPVYTDELLPYSSWLRRMWFKSWI